MTIDRKKLWKKVPGIIRHDFVRKFLSVLLALIVYIAVSDKMGVERDIQNVTVRIPASIVLKRGPEPLTLIKIDGKAPHVKIRIRGSERILKNLSDNDFSIDDPVFNSESYTPGEPYQLVLTPKDVKGPAGVQILSVDPAVVPVDFDILLSKMVEVKAIFDTKKPLPAGYVVSKATVSPPEVRVTGPKLVLDKLEFLQTKQIPLGNITQSFDYNAAIPLSTPTLKVSPANVFVQIDIEKNISTKTFPLLPLRVLDDNTRNSYEFLTGARVEVTVTGLKSLVDALRQEDVKPYVDISTLNQPGIYNVDVGCWITANALEVKSIQPSTVKIKILKK